MWRIAVRDSLPLRTKTRAKKKLKPEDKVIQVQYSRFIDTEELTIGKSHVYTDNECIPICDLVKLIA